MSEPKIVSPATSRITRFEARSSVGPIELTEHFRVVNRYRALVLAVAVSVSFGGVIYAYSKAPVYEGNLLVSVPDPRVVEQRDLLGLPAVSPDRKTSMSESEILRSRVVLGPVVDALHLDINAEPKYPTIIGRAIANWNAGRYRLVDGLGGYAWGGEKLKVSQLVVPQGFRDVTFRISKLDDTSYRVQDADGRINIVGRVGEVTGTKTASGDFKIKVNEISGRNGSIFNVQKVPKVVAIENLRSALSVGELGKESGVINVAFTDKDPSRVEQVLNQVGNTYMRLLEQEKTRGADNSLAILKKQLPEVRKRLEVAEASYESYRDAHSTADFAEQTKLRLARYSASKTQLTDLRQKRAEMSARLGDQHPLLIALDQQIRAVERDGSAVSSELRAYPGVSKELERRARNVQNATDIFNSVVKRIQELSIVSEDRSSSVHVIDDAVVPADPKSSRFVTIIFFAALGIFLGIFAAFLKKMLNRDFNS
ncbi:MAG: Wzz/FepE/Etk N-terminal domain-containing protein [Halobacteriota archaeon]